LRLKINEPALYLNDGYLGAKVEHHVSSAAVWRVPNRDL
jgi:hypothetical protein